MTASLLVTLVGIAAFDSLNPSLFVAQFYLLTTERPISRILSYIAGVMLVNFVGGVLFLAGLWALLRAWFTNLEPTTVAVVQLVLGLGLVLFGLWMRVGAGSDVEGPKPRSLHPIHTFVLGAVVMLNELTTALPYVVAIERIAQAELDSWGNVTALVLYNFVFAVPLLGFLALLIVLGQRFTSQMDRVNRAVQTWVPRVLKYSAVVFGGLVTLDAAAFLASGT